MHKHFLGATFLAALGLATAAQSATLDADALRHMSPRQARAALERQVQRSQSHSSNLGADSTPPVLTAFNAPATFDVGIPDNPMFVPLKATDDRSGVYYAYAYGTGPSGQFVGGSMTNQLPAKSYVGGMEVYTLSGFSEPGTYTFTDLYIADLAGNMRHLEQAELAALGRTSFVVANKRGHDAQQPVLQAGKVLTPQLSLSASPPGTTHAPYAGVLLEALDVGATVVAGVAYASMDFCTLDQSSCFSVWANDTRGSRRAAAISLRLGGEVSSSSVVAGEYHLRNLWITDYAENTAFLSSTEFGGNTDFSAYFPSTVITVTP
ncbi:hypothetical protein [Ideonella sp. YS5]|uniref:hypothetical protein n=1 Tax=Ideonella sp. YS5 TaxID=3453714 RepID=UPI003EE8CEFD